MTRPSSHTARRRKTSTAVRRIGCVSFLNAKPLIDGLENLPDPTVKFDVPSRLLQDLETGEVDIALCPMIDYQRSRKPLEIIPAGCIGCDGTTLTVRLYSRVPIKSITQVHADTDSHTSVALMRVLLAEMVGSKPDVVDYHAREHVANNKPVDWPQAMLLIGDKVVTDSPPAVRYPHQLDLGHAWHELTGLPFVFAAWMTAKSTDLGDLPALLVETREKNSHRLDEIVARHASAHGWPLDLARQYLGHSLKFEFGQRQAHAVEIFFERARALGAITERRLLKIRPL